MSCLQLEPLGSLHFMATLQRFIDLLTSSRGPNGNLKIIVTGGGLSIVTSSSSRMIKHLTLEDPICLYISQVIKAHIDSCSDLGLYVGILTSSVVQQVLSHPEVEISLATQIIQQVLMKLWHSLEIDGDVKIPVEFSSVREMLCIVRCILSTKPACGLKEKECELLAVNIVRAFLETIENSVGQVIVMTGSGATVESHVYHGLLYQMTDKMVQNFYSGSYMTLLLFNIMLSEKLDDDKINTNRCVGVENENGEEIPLDKILFVLKKAIKLNVRIIACQKVVHQSLQIYLKRKGVLLLDRLGTATTEALAKLSGAVPISSVSSEVIDSLDTMLGQVDTVRMTYLNRKPYLCLEHAGGSIMTLFISAISEEATTELQVVVKQCLSALHQLLVQPIVVPGACCLEMWLSATLQQVLDDHSVYDCSRGQLTFALRVVQRAMLSAAGLKLSLSSPVAVDSVYRHAWLSKTLCCCQMVTASDVNSHEGSWCDIVCNDEQTFLPLWTWFGSKVIVPKKIRENIYVSLYYSKVSALNTGFESAVNLLNIGIVINN